MDIHRLAESLCQEEGFRPHAYKDSLGYWTIGYGTLIDERLGGGITEAEARYLLMNRIGAVEVALDRNLPWWRELSEARQQVLAQMCFQMGISRLLGFRKMLAALKAGDFEEAAQEMLDSRWAKQTPARAARLAAMMRKG